MAVSTAKYDPFKIDKLRNYLEDMAQKGHARPFEVFVDNLKIVPKTDAVELFNGFEGYIDEETEKIRILIYDTPSSPRNNQYVYSLKETSAGLNGPGSIDEIVTRKLAHQSMQFELAGLKKELEETKNELTDAEQDNEELREQLKKVRRTSTSLATLISLNLEEWYWKIWQ
jgi:hypothetical protein